MTASTRGQKRNQRMRREGRALNRSHGSHGLFVLQVRVLRGKEAVERVATNLGLQPLASEGWRSLRRRMFQGISRMPQRDGALALFHATEGRLRRGTKAAIRAAVFMVPGVASVQVLSNDTPEGDGAGRPPHSIEVVVQGGDVLDVAQAIQGAAPATVTTHGALSVNGVRFTMPGAAQDLMGALLSSPAPSTQTAKQDPAPCDVCYSCDVSGAALYEKGGQLYQCEARRGACQNLCCSEHSETVTEPDTGSSVIYCLRCHDAAFEAGDD